ncbi:MAG: hypothetical protein HZB30_11140 [Nitrospirae bacterium]|nr:hypothetical protein [Nitrospirota bacterium]
MVGYIDILGYQDLVERAMGRAELVKDLENLFYGVSIGTLKGLRGIDLTKVVEETDEEEQQYFQKITNAIHVRNNADSFIFTLPVSEINFRSTSFDEKTTVLNCIETYFSLMTMFTTLFISKMGYLLRGGISIGKHYESDRDQQLFVFSEAHNRAVTLETKKAVNPRIVMDKNLQLYLKEISYPNIHKFFYEDEDGYYCLNIYTALRIWGDLKEDLLTHVKEGIKLCIESNFNNVKELGKLIYFAKYHNKWVTSAEVNFPHLTFDVEKYERQLEHLETPL